MIQWTILRRHYSSGTFHGLRFNGHTEIQRQPWKMLWRRWKVHVTWRRQGVIRARERYCLTRERAVRFAEEMEQLVRDREGQLSGRHVHTEHGVGSPRR